jgi:hypothetical protein
VSGGAFSPCRSPCLQVKIPRQSEDFYAEFSHQVDLCMMFSQSQYAQKQGARRHSGVHGKTWPYSNKQLLEVCKLLSKGYSLGCTRGFFHCITWYMDKLSLVNVLKPRDFVAYYPTKYSSRVSLSIILPLLYLY